MKYERLEFDDTDNDKWQPIHDIGDMLYVDHCTDITENFNVVHVKIIDRVWRSNRYWVYVVKTPCNDTFNIALAYDYTFEPVINMTAHVYSLENL